MKVTCRMFPFRSLFACKFCYQDHIMQTATRIFGIDPGLRNTGWGVIETKGSSLAFVAAGTVRSDARAPLGERLRQLHEGLSALISDYAPHEAAVEQTFVNRDAQATLKLGHARGVALLVPALAGLPIAEYAPNRVKKTVIGVGHGDKKQIRLMVNMLLPKARFDSDDAADALAIAICHANHRGSSELKIAASF